MDTSIKKRRFYHTQTLGRERDACQWVTKFLLHPALSQAIVTHQGFRRRAYYSIHPEPLGNRLADAERMIRQPSTRHLRGEALGHDTHLSGCVVVLAARDLLSIEVNFDRIDAEPEEDLYAWCDEHLNGWFEFVGENLDRSACGSYYTYQSGYLLFEDERDAIHFKMRWC